MNKEKDTINAIDINYWAYVNKELEELKNVFEETFKGLILHRDYEDTWEWLEGKTNSLEYEFDISRKHNWKQGLYHTELIINIKSKCDIDIDEIGNILKNILSTTIYYGNKVYTGTNDYQFAIIKKYE
jgi:hypothetical protein